MATEQLHSSLELFNPALLDVTNGLLYVLLFSPVLHMVFPINLLDGLPKGSRISIDGPTYGLSESNTTLMGKLV
jgi:hypothetical protein